MGVEVQQATWKPEGARWRLDLSDDSTVTADVVISAVGQLTRPGLPDIAGRELFTGASWHSASWNHDQDLTAARVAVIGTGTSAIQFVPEIAKKAAQVYVFQRSAPFVLPKADRPYRGLSGLLYSVALLAKADRLRIFLNGELLTGAYVASERMSRYVTGRWRQFFEAQVTDPDLRTKATPDYKIGCKRIGFSSHWYPTLAAHNVELVTDPVARITETGVETADGTPRPVDAIVYATGFAATQFLQPMKVVGRHGTSLQATWSLGAEAFGGVAVAGFPNFFMLYGPNSNLGANSVIYMLETQIAYVCGALDAMAHEGLGWMDVRCDIQAEDNRWLISASECTTYRSECHSWYTNAAGRNINNWPTFTFRYRRKMGRMNLLDFDVSPATR